VESPDYYRKKAAELRQVAEAISVDSIKDEYRKIAAQYETLAQEVERADRLHRERKA
jgi:hypothetical protein